LTETAGTAYKTGFPKAFSDFGMRFKFFYSDFSRNISIPTNGTNGNGPFFKYVYMFLSSWGPFTVGTGVIANTGYLDFGVAVTISSYNMRANTGTSGAWTLYGSSDNSTWTSIDNRTGITNNDSILNYAIASPASYRYYKMELKNGQTYNNKSGTGYTIQVNGLQFMGIIT